MSDILMACGHSSNAQRALDDGSRTPACAICGCFEVAKEKPDLTGRIARCTYFGRTFKRRGQTITCHGETNSSYKLPFFEHKPNNKYDKYYCGCWGWD